MRSHHRLAALALAAFALPAQAQQAAPAAAPPPYATTKVEGTDNVYIFCYGGYHRCSS